jgi:hypothetical protein
MMNARMPAANDSSSALGVADVKASPGVAQEQLGESLDPRPRRKFE